MTKKEQFLTFVFCGALSEDMQSDTTDAQLIAQMAVEIPEGNIPHCPANLLQREDGAAVQVDG